MGDKKLVRERVASAIRFSCFVAIPSTVGLTVLAGPVNNLLFSGDNTLAIRMTIYGSLAVVFYSVSTVTNAILQGIDKMRLPIFHAVISLVLHPVIASAVMGLFAFGSYQLVHLAVKSNALSTMFAMMVAVIVYGVLLIKLGALSAAELKPMPGGTKLLRVFRKLHLM